VTDLPRLPSIRQEGLSEDQRVVWEQITGGRRAAAHGGRGGLITAEGGLIGPFNAFLHSPRLGGPAAQLGEAVRFDSTLDRRTLELIIVVVAAHWRSDFEFWAHTRYAREAGVEEELISAVASGADVTFASLDDQRIVEAATEILMTGRLGDDTYDSLLTQLGTSGVVDLVTVVGYYSLVAFNLNVFRVPAPVASSELWPT